MSLGDVKFEYYEWWIEGKGIFGTRTLFSPFWSILSPTDPFKTLFNAKKNTFSCPCGWNFSGVKVADSLFLSPISSLCLHFSGQGYQDLTICGTLLTALQGHQQFSAAARTLLLFSRPMRDKDTSALRKMFQYSSLHYAARAMGAMTIRISELCLSFSPHPNIPDKCKRVQLSLDQMKKKESKSKVLNQIFCRL